MLFVLVFNTLNALFKIAEDAGLFAPLKSWGIKFRLSFFADDVVLLIKPSVTEAWEVVELLKLFGDASGLHCNLTKSSVSPIHCEGVDLQPIMDILGCLVEGFPIQYLGLPLSVVRLSKAELQPLVDKMARSVPAWSAADKGITTKAHYLSTPRACSGSSPIGITPKHSHSRNTR
jgi:hypothetical protein